MTFKPFEICAGCFSKQGEIEKLKAVLKMTADVLDMTEQYITDVVPRDIRRININASIARTTITLKKWAKSGMEVSGD